MQRITWLGALCNLGLAFLKGFLGTLTHSSSLIADAAHSLSDLVTDAITLITLKLVGKPADEHHPYGCICLAGIGIGFEALQNLVTTVARRDLAATTTTTASDSCSSLDPADAPLALLAVLASFTVKEALDALSSAVAGVGIVGAYLHYPLCDPLGGVLVAGMVFRQGAEMLEESAMEGLTRLTLGASQDVLAVDDLKVRRAGSNLLVDVHVAVCDKLTLSGFQNVSNLVKKRIKESVPDVIDVDCGQYRLVYAGGEYTIPGLENTGGLLQRKKERYRTRSCGLFLLPPTSITTWSQSIVAAIGNVFSGSGSPWTVGDLKLKSGEISDLVKTTIRRDCDDCAMNCAEIAKVEVRLELADGCTLISNQLLGG
eukprot:g15971.t1